MKELKPSQRRKVLELQNRFQAVVADRCNVSRSAASQVWNDKTRSERVERAFDAALVELGWLEPLEGEEAA